jgi:hypothetical protein
MASSSSRSTSYSTPVPGQDRQGVIPGWHRGGKKTGPLVCKRCGGPLKVVAYITHTVAIRRILDHLGLSPPEKPPPEVREVVRVPVDDEGREIGANPA